MDILYLMIICSISLGLVFLIVFIINVKKGQFDDDESPAVRILYDDGIKQENTNPENSDNGNDSENKR